MLFNTLAFAKFFAFVFVVSWALSRWPRARFAFLGVMSYAFYAGFDLFAANLPGELKARGWAALADAAPYFKFVPVVWIGSTVDYFLSLWLADTDDPRKRKAIVYLTVAMNTGVLLVFKYWDFLADQAIALGLPAWRLGLPMPTGISFFTFMSLSYVIDVYRRELAPCRNYGHYVTYIAFFPHLVAGPIIRGKDLLPLFAKAPFLTAAAAGEGVLLIAIGLFKKVVISDYLAINLVDRVVAEPTSFSSVEVLAAMFGYAIQIYCDFSGYSDVAIGAALLLGYRLKINFDAPFKASNLVEFWRRWHISLSSWLRDYVYIPLGGSRGKRPPSVARARASLGLTTCGALITLISLYPLVLHFESEALGARYRAIFLAGIGITLVGLYAADQGRKYINVWITMVVCGIWHGAAWRYVFFGVIQGLAVGLSHYYFDAKGKRPTDAGAAGISLGSFGYVVVTFVFTTLTFVLIRAPLDKAMLMYKQLLNFTTFAPNLTPGIIRLILLGLALQWVPRRAFEGLRGGFVKAPFALQAVLLFALAIVLRQAASTEAVPFVYGQF